MKNRKLKKFYNRVYRKGENKHYTPLIFSGDKIPPARAEVLKEISWEKKRVLDAGCGTGELAYDIARRGAKQVLGVDYSREAIAIARKNYRHEALSYECKNIRDVHGCFDVIVSLGTLEHLDNPEEALRFLKNLLTPDGDLIITCPNWLNPRGFILMTLRYLFGARITLADLNYFTPLDFEHFAKKLSMKLQWKTVDYDWGQGGKMVQDFARRIPRVLKDSNLPRSNKKIGEFLYWLKTHVADTLPIIKSSGAVALYRLRKNNVFRKI